MNIVLYMFLRCELYDGLGIFDIGLLYGEWECGVFYELFIFWVIKLSMVIELRYMIVL